MGQHTESSSGRSLLPPCPYRAQQKLIFVDSFSTILEIGQFFFLNTVSFGFRNLIQQKHQNTELFPSSILLLSFQKIKL